MPVPHLQCSLCAHQASLWHCREQYRTMWHPVHACTTHTSIHCLCMDSAKDYATPLSLHALLSALHALHVSCMLACVIGGTRLQHKWCIASQVSILGICRFADLLSQSLIQRRSISCAPCFRETACPGAVFLSVHSESRRMGFSAQLSVSACAGAERFCSRIAGPTLFPGWLRTFYRHVQTDEMSYKDMAGHCQDIDPILRICTHKHFLTNFG